MGIFGTSNDVTVTDEVEKATTENNPDEDWACIMTICDKAGKSAEDAKNYLKAITKRLYNSDPHVGVKAVTVLDACVKNSGKLFHIEVASRDFENDFYKLMFRAHPTVGQKLRESLKKWSENEFKSDKQLTLVPSLYSKLKKEGLDFSSSEQPVKKSAPISKDPNVVESQEEEEQILKAIELSLKESSGGSPKASTNTTSSSLYPSVNMASASSAPAHSTPPKEPRKVRALYDFEAAEDNELTFSSGEIIFVIDDSDPNWWKGSNQRGEGLFPANFVTADLSVEPEKFLFEKAKKIVQFNESVDVKDVVEKAEPEEVEINEDKIDRLLHLLHEADPTNPERDTEEMLKLEKEVNGMGPLIDSELERVDRKHAQLTQLSADLVEALGLYHSLMREPQFSTMNKMNYGYSPSPGPMSFNGNPQSMNMHPSMMGPPSIGGPGPGLPPGHDRPQYIPQSGSQSHFPPNMPMQAPGIITSQGHLPPSTHIPHGMPPGIQHPGLPPHMHTHIPDDRRPDPNQMGHYPGIPSFIPQQNMPPPGFPQNGPVTPQGGPPQQQPGLHYVSSSTHMMH